MIARTIGASLLAFWVLVGCTMRERAVVRIAGGQRHVGRFISPAAYAYYTRGAYLESHGQLDWARMAYTRALTEDPRSVQAWTRLAAVRCRLNVGEASAAFGRAEQLAPDYAPLWRERARCRQHRGQHPQAVAAAERAIQLDPNRQQTSLLLIQLYEQAGRVNAAQRWLDALVARHPDSIVAHQALLDFTLRHDRPARRALAERRLQRLTSDGVTVRSRVSSSAEPSRGVDRALRASRLQQARQRAHRAGISPGVLAVRAAALGVPSLARRQAQLVLDADPTNANAWIAALVAADLEGDRAAFHRALRRLDPGGPAPTPLAARVLAELLHRRLGQQAARIWLESYGPFPSVDDELQLHLEKRATSSDPTSGS